MLSGQTLTQAVKEGLRERLDRQKASASDQKRLVERVMELGRRASSRPLLDARTPEAERIAKERTLPKQTYPLGLVTKQLFQPLPHGHGSERLAEP